MEGSLIKKTKLIIICITLFSLLASGCAVKTTDSLDNQTVKTDISDNDSVKSDKSDKTDKTDKTDKADIESAAQDVAEGSSEEITEPAAKEGKENLEGINVEIGLNYVNEYNDDYSKQYLCIKYPAIRLSEADSVKYPALADSLNIVSSGIEDSTLYSKDSLLADSIELNDSLEDYAMTFSDESNINLVRADSRVLSFWVDSYSYYGGAHGYGAQVGYNFDSEKGYRIEQSDIITNYEKLYDLIDKKLNKYYPDLLSEEGFQYYVNDNEAYDFNFVIGNEGLEFVFNTYELGCYAEGSQTVNFSFDELNGVINEKYLKEPGGYIEYFGAYDEEYVNGEPIYVNGEMDEYETYVSLTVTHGNNTYNDNDFWGFSLSPFIVSTKNGNKYLMIASDEENDYMLITILDINNGIKKIGTISGIKSGIYDESYNRRYYLYQTDPSYYRLEERTDILGTREVHRYYEISEEGEFIPYTDYYFYSNNAELTAKRRVSGIRINEAFDEEGRIDIMPNEKVIPLYTDNETYAVVKNMKGELIKLMVDQNYPMSINGVEVDRLFYNIMYAG